MTGWSSNLLIYVDEKRTKPIQNRKIWVLVQATVRNKIYTIKIVSNGLKSFTNKWTKKCYKN